MSAPVRSQCSGRVSAGRHVAAPALAHLDCGGPQLGPDRVAVSAYPPPWPDRLVGSGACPGFPTLPRRAVNSVRTELRFPRTHRRGRTGWSGRGPPRASRRSRGEPSTRSGPSCSFRVPTAVAGPAGRVGGLPRLPDASAASRQLGPDRVAVSAYPPPWPDRLVGSGAAAGFTALPQRAVNSVRTELQFRVPTALAGRLVGSGGRRGLHGAPAGSRQLGPDRVPAGGYGPGCRPTAFMASAIMDPTSATLAGSTSVLLCLASLPNSPMYCSATRSWTAS